MTLLVPAIVLISAALVAYTAGVWLEHRNGRLQPRHALAFALGLAFDASGTWLMSRISASGQRLATDEVTGVLSSLMAVTGGAALILMAAHLAWAVYVLLRGGEAARRSFHRFSTAVWALWLVPYVTGMAAAMLS